MRHSAFCILALLAACATPPRPSTQEERDAATIIINKARTAVVLLVKDAGKRELALSQLERFQARVDSSATAAISWIVLYDELATFAVEWAIPAPK